MNHKSFGHLLSAIVRCLFSLFVAIGALNATPLGSALAAPAPDLVVTKTDSPDPVLVGNNLTYTVTVRNQGNAKAYSVVMTDTLPVSATLVGVSTTKGACSRPAGQVICSLGTLNKNGSARVTIITRPTAAGVITNTATASTTSAETNLANNTASATTTINSLTDLSITKTDVTDPVYVGDRLGYTIAVSNAGPSNATGVVVTDTLASSLTFVSASPGCILSGRTLICTIGALAASGNRTITVTVTPTVAAAGTLINTAVVSSNEADSNLTNNMATASTTVLPKTDLSVGQSSTPTPALLGNLLTYAVVVANDGPSAATGVVLTDTLPAGVTLASAPAGCSQSANVVTCTIGTMTGGSSVTTTLTVTPTATGMIANGVSVTGNEFDPNVTNNSNSLSTTVVPAADLSLTQTRVPGLVLVGDTLTYTLVLTNSGPSDATNVVLTDTLQGHVILSSATPSQGNCNETSMIVCPLGTLGHGTTATLTVVVNTTVEEVTISTATATSDVADPFLANNTTTLRTAVNPVDLSVSKVGSPALVMAGQQLTYTLVVTNNGPLPGTNIVLTDALPASVNLAFTSPGTLCAGVSTVVCSMGDMSVGMVATVTLAVTPTESGMVVNTASVTADEPDPDPTNNSATATNGVNPVDLVLTKTAAPNPAHSGDLITFMLIITDHGPSNAAGVVVTDTLPGNMAFGSAPAGCFYATVVVCPVGTLANDDARILTVTARLAPDATGIITNTAVVASIEPDTVPANNTAQVGVVVRPQANLSVDKIAGPNPVYVGNSLTYIVTVINNGPSAATNVVITDVLPAGITFNWALPDCTPSGGTVICNMGAVASGDGATAMIVVTPTAAAAGTVTNTVAVGGNEFDPNTTDNRAIATTLVLAKADVVVSKKATPDPAQSGSSLVYTVVVTNTGPSVATGVLMTDTLPGGVNFGSVSSGCAQAGGVVTCVLGSIAGGQSKTVNITVTPQAATAGTFIDNMVEASANEFDPDLNSNTFVLSTAVDPADLAIAKTATPASLVVGKTLTYTLAVTNYGPSNSTGVLVYDSLPDNVTFKSATPGCALAAGILTCDLANMNTGVGKAVTITVVPTASGLITNTADVDANEADANMANNTSSVTTRVTPIYHIYLPAILR